jgi:tetratricopeptide (TPR) repeat protein
MELAATAIADLDARRYESAEDTARTALALDPACPRARAALGLALANRGALVDPMPLHLQNQADGETLWAARRDPTDPVVVRLRARFLALVGHYSAAAEVAEAWLSTARFPLDGDGVALLALAAEWRYELGEERAALRHLRPLVEVRPDDAIAHFRLGSCRLRTATMAAEAIAAVPAFARCAELAPGDADAHRSVGCAQARAAELARQAEGDVAAREHLQAAAGTFTAVAALFPEDAETCFQLGVVREALGDAAAAATAYERALARSADHLGALLNLAALRLAGSAEAAAVAAGRQLLQRALEVDAAHGGLSEAERSAVRELLAK